MLKNGVILCLAAGLMAVTIGCASTSTTMRAGSDADFRGGTMPSLVTTDQQRTTLDATRSRGWEQSRADARAARERVPEYADVSFIEVRSREQLRTVNGRPQEFSSTSTRIIRRGAIRRQR